jgi:hypothetical protein
MGRVFNFRSVCVQSARLCCCEAKLLSLKLKTRTKQLLVSFPLVAPPYHGTDLQQRYLEAGQADVEVGAESGHRNVTPIFVAKSDLDVTVI